MSQSRQPKGVPTGGQYATSSRNEASTALALLEPNSPLAMEQLIETARTASSESERAAAVEQIRERRVPLAPYPDLATWQTPVGADPDNQFFDLTSLGDLYERADRRGDSLENGVALTRLQRDQDRRSREMVAAYRSANPLPEGFPHRADGLDASWGTVEANEETGLTTQTIFMDHLLPGDRVARVGGGVYTVVTNDGDTAKDAIGRSMRFLTARVEDFGPDGTSRVREGKMLFGTGGIAHLVVEP